MIDITIGQYKVGAEHAPFIIADMSANHNQSLSRALQIVEAAAKAGVHALKLQTYTADSMTIDVEKADFIINDKNSLWNGRKLYELYQQAATPWEWHKPIFELCKKLGMIGFSTPFDATAVDHLESLDVPCYKVASFENIDLPLINKIALTGKPMIISTGMATLEEIRETVGVARASGCKDVILLKCTSSYPASPANSNIATIPHMRDQFDCQVGLSDHSLGLGVAVASIALGATVIEKHFTLSRSDGGVDSAFSLEPEEMTGLTFETRQAWQAVGKISYGPTEKEKSSLVFRRSLYVVKDMKAGDALTRENLRAIRPGHGLAPKYYDELLGKKVIKDISKGTAANWEIIK